MASLAFSHSRVLPRRQEPPRQTIYVSVNFERDTPDLLKNSFRSHLRALSDVELVDGPTGDIILRILATPTTHNGQGEKTAYAVSVLALVLWEKPDYPADSTLEEVKSGQLLVFPIEGMDSGVRDAIASIDNDVFEDFRRTWPYRQTSSQ